MRILEAFCPKCQISFNPQDEQDLIHGECGTECEISGEWIYTPPA